MAIIGTALTTLEQAKEWAGVSAGNVRDDTYLERLINTVSMIVSTKCDRIFGGAAAIPEYTEYLNPPNRQILLLKQWPIVSVTSVTDNTVALVLNTDYRCDAQEKARGELYKESGWRGSSIVSGLTLDIVSSTRSLIVVYKAGYYLPGDTVNYVEGSESSLPLDLTYLVNDIIAEMYWKRKNGAFGLSSYSEGGISWSYNVKEVVDGHDDAFAKFKRWI